MGSPFQASDVLSVVGVLQVLGFKSRLGKQCKKDESILGRRLGAPIIFYRLNEKHNFFSF